MSLKMPKTGLANRMREWMSKRTGSMCARRFTIQELCEALGIEAGPMHQKVANALYDFYRRGEVTSRFNRKCNRRHYLYKEDNNRRLWGKQNQIIFRAMYISPSFSVTDIQRITEISTRSGIEKMIRLFRKEGYVQQIARRKCANGISLEKVYRITNSNRFKLEIMKG